MAKATYEDAQKIVEVLIRETSVLGVDLFGSVARKGEGNDLDFILLVPDDVAKRWWDITRMHIQPQTFWTKTYHWLKKNMPFFEKMAEHKRKLGIRQVANELLGIDVGALTIRACGRSVPLDTVFMPQDWRHDAQLNTEKLTSHYNCSQGTLEFFARIIQNIKRLP